MLPQIKQPQTLPCARHSLAILCDTPKERLEKCRDVLSKLHREVVQEAAEDVKRLEALKALHAASYA